MGMRSGHTRAEEDKILAFTSPPSRNPEKALIGS
jgi:hypothetical protein